MFYHPHPSEERLVRQTRSAVELLLDGAYRQIEVLHRKPDGTLDDMYETAINELLEHVREEVESRVIQSLHITEE